jgi:hypothetical protein
MTETDGDAVPGIDSGKHHRQVNQFCLVKLVGAPADRLRRAHAPQRSALQPRSMPAQPARVRQKGRIWPDGDGMDLALIHA